MRRQNFVDFRQKCYDDTFDEKRHAYDDEGKLKSIESLEFWRRCLFRKIKEAMEDDPSSVFVAKKTVFFNGLKAYIEKRRKEEGFDTETTRKRNLAWLEKEGKEEGLTPYEIHGKLLCHESIEGEENDIPAPPLKKRTPSDWENKKA